MDELLARAEILTLHVSLDDSTRDMLAAERLVLMKPTNFRINLAHGGLVDEVALKRALIKKHVAATFNVFAGESPQDQELLNLTNFLSSPHIGGSGVEAGDDALDLGDGVRRDLRDLVQHDDVGELYLLREQLGDVLAHHLAVTACFGAQIFALQDLLTSEIS